MGRAIKNFKWFLGLTSLFILVGLLYLTGDALAPSPPDPKGKKPTAVKKKTPVVQPAGGGYGQAALRELKRLVNKARREVDRMMR